MKEKINKKIIGRLEFVDIPEFDLFGITAKIDTGAYNSAIHVSSVTEFEKDGKKWIRFIFLDDSHPNYHGRVYETDQFEDKKIKSSNGGISCRFLINTLIKLKGEDIKVKLGLSDRKGLRHPVLVGRKGIKKHFIIDASKKFTDNK